MCCNDVTRPCPRALLAVTCWLEVIHLWLQDRKLAFGNSLVCVGGLIPDDWERFSPISLPKGAGPGSGVQVATVRFYSHPAKSAI